ncbi:arylamine N-acetyltransferase family protein [Thermomonospora amylolytica]|uniref:arylamine N-acetyltransferase family protein n=1 Tax=Thermomonospora amylolytica TaxID=1411117 RepID=UPI000E6D480C|nr:arylamine N-acetyltransferase [Thermomonospora amylolytica]
MERSHDWHGDALDLSAYLERIGLPGDRAGERAPTLDTLRALQRAHVTAIPFENLEIILGRSIPLDLPSLQDKLVRRRRGGYCYEHAILFAAALERLGFGVVGLHGRVTLGATSPRPATHALLHVTVPGLDGAWLCDVGFGSGPLEPLELKDGLEADQDGWRFRLERRTAELDTGLWTLHQLGPEGWIDRHTFTVHPQYLIDYVVGSHFVATSPRSPFTTRPFAQRFTGSEHHVLDGLTWTTTLSDGSCSVQELKPDQVPDVLDDVFDITLSPDDRDRLRS